VGFYLFSCTPGVVFSPLQAESENQEETVSRGQGGTGSNGLASGVEIEGMSKHKESSTRKLRRTLEARFLPILQRIPKASTKTKPARRPPSPPAALRRARAGESLRNRNAQRKPTARGRTRQRALQG
jgi:hypothetical protein